MSGGKQWKLIGKITKKIGEWVLSPCSKANQKNLSQTLVVSMKKLKKRCKWGLKFFPHLNCGGVHQSCLKEGPHRGSHKEPNPNPNPNPKCNLPPGLRGKAWWGS